MTEKQQWQALFSAYRAAQHECWVRDDGWTEFVHPDVAAVRAIAIAVDDGRVRAGFALRHGNKLRRVLADAETAKRDWEHVLPGAIRTLPRYVRGMAHPRHRIKAGGYGSRWSPRYLRINEILKQWLEELPPAMRESDAS